MANEESKIVPANLKVPPLKIVLSTFQSSTNVVGSVSVAADTSPTQKTSGDKTKETGVEEHSSSSTSSSSSKRNGGTSTGGVAQCSEKHQKRATKTNSESLDDSTGAVRPTRFLSTSSSTSSSDRSSSTTPSSESESLASNSTIISENQQHEKSKSFSTVKDETGGAKQDKNSTRHGAPTSKTANTDKSNSTNFSSTPNKRTLEQEQIQEQQTPSNLATAKDQTSSLNANQRITRSSQRAAQQTKASETTTDTNVDEQIPNETYEKIPDSSRKVKRRKGEVQDTEHDTQSAAQATPTMANICPADYVLPSQNSFELYRDIRKEPYKKLLKLNHIQPKVPLGFKDYLINGGPYLLEGNKLGTGIGVNRLDNLDNGQTLKTTTSNRIPLKAKASNHKNTSLNSLLQRHSLYTIPKPMDPPKSLQVGTPLYELFQEQERARQQMRMQHLKERERAILAAEQEILRAYNNAAIADVKQKRHLSACTFFYYQERYHYLDDKTDNSRLDSSRQLEGDSSFLIDEDQNLNSKETVSAKEKNFDHPTVDTNGIASGDTHGIKEEKNEDKRDSGDKFSVKTQSDKNDSLNAIEEDSTVRKQNSPKTNGAITSANEMSEDKSRQRKSLEDIEGIGGQSDVDLPASNNIDEAKSLEQGSSESSLISPFKQCSSRNKNISDVDLKLLNKEIFIAQLDQIDDKWDYIKRDMMVRHKNEADSLNALQSLDWEWKAKEIGFCDVRVTLKIEPELVPKVEVEAHDY